MVEKNAIVHMNPKFLCNTVNNHMEWRYCYWDLHTLSCCFFPICAINFLSLVSPPFSSINDTPSVALMILRPLISIILESMLRKMKQLQQPRDRICKRQLEMELRSTKGIARTGYSICRGRIGLSMQINKQWHEWQLHNYYWRSKRHRSCLWLGLCVR